MQLNQDNLSQIAKQLPVPAYNRQAMKKGVVHIGVGGFHRAHQAWYLHELSEKYGLADWAICGVGLRAADRKMAEVMARQDGLYTLVTQHPSGKIEATVVGAIQAYLWAIDAPLAVIAQMAHPDTRIVSLTITEGGYNFNPVTGHFDFENPDIQYELAHPAQPRTVYGYLTAALRKRRAAGLPPFTILSCDNIQHNGDVCRKMVLAFAERQDPDLAQWIADKVSFPNSMVDRITPVTSPETVQYLQDTYGLSDEWPVVCEPFIQWVIEDNFSNGRPPLEQLGVQLVADVTPYEKMKIRLLNAGHSVLGIPGALYGHPTIDACMKDPVFARFMRQFMDQEVTPVLDPVTGVDLTAYKDSLEERFANPYIKDSVARICSESSAKLPKFLLPTLRENLASGGSIRYATFILAAWCYYSGKGVDQEGRPLEVIDAQEAVLRQAAQETTTGDWTAFLQQAGIFGDLPADNRFVEEYQNCVKAIYTSGDIRQLMADMLAQEMG